MSFYFSGPGEGVVVADVNREKVVLVKASDAAQHKIRQWQSSFHRFLDLQFGTNELAHPSDL
jgi:hypothetical protein